MRGRAVDRERRALDLDVARRPVGVLEQQVDAAPLAVASPRAAATRSPRAPAPRPSAIGLGHDGGSAALVSTLTHVPPSTSSVCQRVAQLARRVASLSRSTDARAARAPCSRASGCPCWDSAPTTSSPSSQLDVGEEPLVAPQRKRPIAHRFLDPHRGILGCGASRPKLRLGNPDPPSRAGHLVATPAGNPFPDHRRRPAAGPYSWPTARSSPSAGAIRQPVAAPVPRITGGRHGYPVPTRRLPRTPGGGRPRLEPSRRGLVRELARARIAPAMATLDRTPVTVHERAPSAGSPC